MLETLRVRLWAARVRDRRRRRWPILPPLLLHQPVERTEVVVAGGEQAVTKTVNARTGTPTKSLLITGLPSLLLSEQPVPQLRLGECAVPRVVTDTWIFRVMNIAFSRLQRFRKLPGLFNRHRLVGITME
jgi:hypothetical protein